jgi:hypothetical protein
VLKLLVAACAVALLSVPAPAQTAGGAGAPTSEVGASPAPPSREALQWNLDEILARPDYRRAMRGGGGGSLRDLLLRLRRLLERLGGLHETNHALFVVAVTVGCLLVVVLLGHIAYTLVRALRKPGGPRSGPGRVVRERPRTPEELCREADELAERGEFRQAVRSFYLALTRSLQLAGLLPRSTSQTNWERVQHLRDHAALVAIVQPFTEVFDAKWYGQRPASAEDVERCRGWFEAALQEVEAP